MCVRCAVDSYKLQVRGAEEPSLRGRTRSYWHHLRASSGGILFRPPQNVIDEFPQFPVTRNYDEFAAAFLDASRRI